jgi:hypothetical protein
VSYRPALELPVLQQMTGLPAEGFELLVRVLVRVCDDPYDRVHSAPLSADGRSRLAELADSGFIVLEVDEAARLVRVHELVWTG